MTHSPPREPVWGSSPPGWGLCGQVWVGTGSGPGTVSEGHGPGVWVRVGVLVGVGVSVGAGVSVG
ncbi:hypothetical protein, partial [Streptomyces sp. sk2.1]|uniref:hypothetical protein n=1 Tax=Streptomyces sp. sk2.1 TaxID=2478959 RepID=UPI001CA32E8E